MSRPLAIVVSCEHGGNGVPRKYARWFADADAALASHRGYDPGALATARAIARAFEAPLVAATVSRLVVELNRSRGHGTLFSPMMAKAPEPLREQALEEIYFPHRARVEAMVKDEIARGNDVVHVASHSFTPVLNGLRRRADVGLLFDPARALERAVCAAWRSALRSLCPQLAVHRNRPYRGTSDGLTRELRTRFDESRYAGIELEINQRFVADGTARLSSLNRHVVAALRLALAALAAGARVTPGRPSSRAHRVDSRATA